MRMRFSQVLFLMEAARVETSLAQASASQAMKTSADPLLIPTLKSGQSQRPALKTGIAFGVVSSRSARTWRHPFLLTVFYVGIAATKLFHGHDPKWQSLFPLRRRFSPQD